MRTDFISGKSHGVNLPLKPDGADTVLMNIHTHPEAESAHRGMSFSGKNIFGLKGRSEGFIELIEIGINRYAVIATT